MRRPRARVSGAEWGLLGALAAWGTFPLVLLLVHALQAHARFTGADGLIGADGVLGADQLQYLAWARDAGAHGLASNLFSLAPSGHVFLEPLYTITGGLWRLGMSLQVAYVLWKPVAAVALFAAAVAWAWRMFELERGARLAAIALSLFLYTPLSSLVNWASLGSGPFRFQMYLLGWELLPANKLWGYIPSALSLAMVPLALLALERALRPPQGASPGLWVALATVAALLACSLHPWQGVTLFLIFAGLAVWDRLRGWRALLVPAAGAALPLVYYLVMSRSDAAWQLASKNEVVGRLPFLALLAGFGPLLVVAGAGLRRPGDVPIERALLLWVLATFVTYFAVDSFPPHALEGLSFPLAILAVRGWRRLRLPAVLGALAIAVLTLPGLAFDARKFARVARRTIPQYYLTASESRALDWLARRAPPGGVLAPTPFAIVVPSQTGRAVWVGHPYWSGDYFARARAVDRFFGGRLRPARARVFLLGTGASLLVSDCAHATDLSPALKGLLASVHRFGCATVYVVRRPGRLGQAPR